jgi:hypothetical protein
MTGDTRLLRRMWAATAATIAGDEDGLDALLCDLDDDDLLLYAGVATQVIAGLLTRGCDPDEWLALIREQLARTADDDD